jgi:hypothetical protein
MDIYAGLTQNEEIEIDSFWKLIAINLTVKKLKQLEIFLVNILEDNKLRTVIRNEIRSKKNQSIKLTNVMNYINRLPIHNIPTPYQEESWLSRPQNERFSRIQDRIFNSINALAWITFTQYPNLYETFIKKQINLPSSDNIIATNIINYINTSRHSDERGLYLNVKNKDYYDSPIRIYLTGDNDITDTYYPLTDIGVVKNRKTLVISELYKFKPSYVVLPPPPVGYPNTEFISHNAVNHIMSHSRINTITDCHNLCINTTNCVKFSYSPVLKSCKLSNSNGIISISGDPFSRWTTGTVERFQNVEKCENNDYTSLLILIILLLAVIFCLKYNF